MSSKFLKRSAAAHVAHKNKKKQKKIITIPKQVTKEEKEEEYTHDIEEEEEEEEDLATIASSSVEKEVEKDQQQEKVPEEESTKNQKELARTTTTLGQKYVPPHLRNQTVDSSELLRKQIRSIINKLSTSNLESLFNEMENIFLKNSRNEVNKFLSTSILDNFVDSSQVLTKLASVTANMALIAMLHLAVGIEVGAYFLETLATRFKSFYDQKKSKECSNLILMFTHLYTFQVVHCIFIYDIIRMLVNSFTEMDIELLLLLLKHSGFQLRSDDPAALKEIILSVKEKAAASGVNLETTSTKTGESDQFNLRVKFMLQTIFDLKNNKRKASEDDSLLQQTKKTIRSILSKKNDYSDNPLRITWNEILETKTKGRWWLVGSAWAGAGPQASKNANTQRNGEDDQLLSLAKSHKMNTDVRRSIFCAIMSSEDFLDAFEKLSKLNLQGKQEREIVSIVLHCCQQEKKFNEFYAHLATKLCGQSSNYKFSFQTSFWDKFKQLPAMTNARQISNLALLLASLLQSNSLTLTVLKVVNFQQLDARSTLFFRLMLTHLLTKPTKAEVEAIFQRALTSKSSLGIKEALTFFFLQESLHYQTSTNLSEQQLLYLKRMKLAKEILQQAEINPFET